MANIKQCLKNYLFLSKKDIVILSAIFVTAFVSSFVFLWTNSIYLDRLNFTMQILSVILFILLGMHVSFFVYTLISQPSKLIPKLQHLQNSGILQKTISEIVFLNILALANFCCLTVSYLFELQNIQIFIVSISVATWPLFFLILMNMDVSLYSNKMFPTCNDDFCGMAVAENCGPAVVPSNRS